MTIELLVRGKFIPLPDAVATPLTRNSWNIRIPALASMKKKTRRGAAMEDWDGAVFCLDGQETEPAMASAGGEDQVTVAVWIV